MARVADEVRQDPGPPDPAAEPRGRGFGPRRHDALVRGDRRRRRDPRGRRLLPLRATAGSTRRCGGSTPSGEPVDIITAVEALKRARASSTTSAVRSTCATWSTRCRRPPARRTTRGSSRRRGAAPPADRRGGRHHGHGVRGADRPRRRRRRRRAADLRRRPPRGRRGGRDPRATWSTRRWSDLEYIQNRDIGLHGAADGVPRPRRPHVGAAAGQPDRHRGAPGRRQVVARHEHRPQRRGRRTHPGGAVLPRDVALRDRHAPAVRGGAGRRGTGSATSASVPTTGPAWCRRPRSCTTRRCTSSTPATSTSSTSARRPAGCGPAARGWSSSSSTTSS